MSVPLRVLIVGASEQDALALVRQLEAGGYSPVSRRVETAAAMEAALGEEPWDLVVIEHTMSEQTGVEALELLQEIGTDIPLIVVCGAIGEEAAADVMRCGARDVVLKDNLGRLVPAVRREVQEAERRQLQRDVEDVLGESEERYRSVVDNIGVGVTIISPAMEILWLNNQMKSRFPHIDASKRPICYRAFNDPPREDICSYCPTCRTLRDGRAHEVVTETPARGETRNARIVSSPLRNRAGEVVAAVEMVEDITAQRRAEEQVRQTLAELERSNAELEQFAYVASHDLQEPLRKVLAFGARLEARCGDALDEQGLDYLERMGNACERMRELINDLLMYSRITTRAQPFVPVALGEVARDVLSDLEALVEETGGRVELGELPTIDADALQMRQLLQNLIGNALKFHPDDEPPVVKVYGEPAEDRGTGEPDGPSAQEMCKVVVADNGIGFEERHLDRMFGVFQRLHGRGKYEGTGMGLAICRKIAERHGGSITARSAPGKGSRFITTLPINHIKAGDAR